MEVCADLHLLAEQFDDILPKQCVSDSFKDGRGSCSPMASPCRSCIAARLRTHRRNRRGDLVDDLCIAFSIVGEIQRNFLVKSIDEEVKELVFVDFTVCLLLVLGYIFSKQTFQLTGFVGY